MQILTLVCPLSHLQPFAPHRGFFFVCWAVGRGGRGRVRGRARVGAQVTHLKRLIIEERFQLYREWLIKKASAEGAATAAPSPAGPPAPPNGAPTPAAPNDAGTAATEQGSPATTTTATTTTTTITATTPAAGATTTTVDNTAVSSAVPATANAATGVGTSSSVAASTTPAVATPSELTTRLVRRVLTGHQVSLSDGDQTTSSSPQSSSDMEDETDEEATQTETETGTDANASAWRSFGGHGRSSDTCCRTDDHMAQDGRKAPTAPQRGTERRGDRRGTGAPGTETEEDGDTDDNGSGGEGSDEGNDGSSDAGDNEDGSDGDSGDAESDTTAEHEGERHGSKTVTEAHVPTGGNASGTMGGASSEVERTGGDSRQDNGAPEDRDRAAGDGDRGDGNGSEEVKVPVQNEASSKAARREGFFARELAATNVREAMGSLTFKAFIKEAKGS